MTATSLTFLNVKISRHQNTKFKSYNLFNIRLNNKRRTINFNDLAYLESDSNYTYFYFKNGEKAMSSFTLKNIIERAGNTDNFFRVSRAIYLNLSIITSITPDKVFIQNGKSFVVSRRRQKQLVAAYQKSIEKV